MKDFLFVTFIFKLKDISSFIIPSTFLLIIFFLAVVLSR